MAVRALVPAGVDPARRVPFPTLDNIKLPLGEDFRENVTNLRLFFQLIIKYGKLTEVMDLRVMFETLMLDNRYKELFKEPSLIRLVAEMYGWSDVSDGVKGNNSMIQKGKKFHTHVMNRMWQNNYCTFCGSVCGKPMKLTLEQARQAAQIRLPHIRSLLHVVLCKSCVSKVMVVQSRVSSMAPGRSDMLRAVLDHLPSVLYNGGKWWLRSSVTRCIKSLDEHVGNLDDEIEKAKINLNNLLRKKKAGENYKEVLEKCKPADLDTIFGKKNKRKAEPEEDDEEDMHQDKRVPTFAGCPDRHDDFRGYYNWCKVNGQVPEKPNPSTHYDLYHDWCKDRGLPCPPLLSSSSSSSSSSAAASAYYTPFDQEEDEDDDSSDDPFPSRAGLRPATYATPSRPPPFTPDSPHLWSNDRPPLAPTSPTYTASSPAPSPISPDHYSPSTPCAPLPPPSISPTYYPSSPTYTSSSWTG